MDKDKLIKYLPKNVKVTIKPYGVRVRARIKPYIKGKLKFTSKKAKLHFVNVLHNWSRVDFEVGMYKNPLTGREGFSEFVSRTYTSHPHIGGGGNCIDLSLVDFDDQCELEYGVAKLIINILAIISNIEIGHYVESSYSAICVSCGRVMCGVKCEHCGACI